MKSSRDWRQWVVVHTGCVGHQVESRKMSNPKWKWSSCVKSWWHWMQLLMAFHLDVLFRSEKQNRYWHNSVKLNVSQRWQVVRLFKNWSSNCRLKLHFGKRSVTAVQRELAPNYQMGLQRCRIVRNFPKFKYRSIAQRVTVDFFWCFWLTLQGLWVLVSFRQRCRIEKDGVPGWRLRWNSAPSLLSMRFQVIGIGLRVDGAWSGSGAPSDWPVD